MPLKECDAIILIHRHSNIQNNREFRHYRVRIKSRYGASD